jgi:membrane dipeptidase
MKKEKLAMILAIALITIVAIIAFSIGPSVVEKRLNPANSQAVQPITPSSKTLHQNLTIVDLHADSLLWGRDLSVQANHGHVDIPRLIQGNVALQTFTVVTKVPNPLKLQGNSDRHDNLTKLAILQRWPISAWFSLKQRALYQAKRLHQISGPFEIIKTKQDLNNYLDRRKQNAQITAGWLGLEGAQALEGKIENVDQLYDAGFRLIGLTHFFDNEVSGSAHGLDGGGLTAFGRQVIQRMEALNMTIDLAHASAQTIDDVLQIAQRPVLVSHTGVQGTCNNARNLSDRQLQKITQAGGIIGIGFWETAICGKDINSIVRSIRYVADRFGIDHVALGSDFDGSVRLPLDVAHLDQITQALQKEGFSEEAIGKIMGLNVIQFLQKSLP